MNRRISDQQLKSLGFRRVDSMQCFERGGVIVSYGLIVAIGNTTADGYHDYSSTTAKQVTRATGMCTADRRKYWNIVTRELFSQMVNDCIRGLDNEY